MEIKRIPNEDENEVLYQVKDDATLEGVFYLTVDRANQRVIVYSIDQNGQPDESDLLLISSRVGLEGGEEEEGGMSWPITPDQSAGDLLFALLGSHGQIVARDLGIEDQIDPALWGDAMEDPAPPVSHETPLMVQVSDVAFQFDPDAQVTEPDPDADPAELDPDDFNAGPDGSDEAPDATIPDANELDV